jgi:hypothetical protein
MANISQNGTIEVYQKTLQQEEHEDGTNIIVEILDFYFNLVS